MRFDAIMPRRPFTREQQWLMPPTLDQMIPSDHIVRFVASFVDELDFERLGLAMPVETRGAPAYHPAVLTGACVYGFTRADQCLYDPDSFHP